jgi:hypothetical protein
MTEREIENLLADRHAKDVFIPQCKDGPTTGGLSIMDGWAMNRSWSRLTFWGYEIKVSKQDFIHDEKWHTYLPYCNQLYFVCPKGVISVESVPDGVGLIYALPRHLKIVKKAAHRGRNPPKFLVLRPHVPVGDRGLDLWGRGCAR